MRVDEQVFYSGLYFDVTGEVYTLPGYIADSIDQFSILYDGVDFTDLLAESVRLDIDDIAYSQFIERL